MCVCVCVCVCECECVLHLFFSGTKCHALLSIPVRLACMSPVLYPVDLPILLCAVPVLFASPSSCCACHLYFILLTPPEFLSPAFLCAVPVLFASP